MLFANELGLRTLEQAFISLNRTSKFGFGALRMECPNYHY